MKYLLSLLYRPRYKYFIVALFSLLLSSVPSVSFAVSVYDDAYKSTTFMPVSDNPGYWGDCIDVNVTKEWSEYITDSSFWGYSGLTGTSAETAKTAFLNAFQNGSYAVSYSEYPYYSHSSGSRYASTVKVYFTSSKNAKLLWEDNLGSIPYRAVNYSVPVGDTLSSITISAFEGNNDQTGNQCRVRMSEYQANTGSTQAVISNSQPMHNSNDVYANQTTAFRSFVVGGIVNFNYPTNYAGARIVEPSNATGGPTGTVAVGCESMDLKCMLGSVFTGIGDTFNAVSQGIVSAITWIFVPDFSKLSTAFSSLMDSFVKQLGFLSYPFTWVAKMFAMQAVRPSHADCDISYFSNQTPTFMGTQFHVDPCSFMDNQYGQFLQVMIRAILSFALVTMFHKKYLEVVKG